LKKNTNLNSGDYGSISLCLEKGSRNNLIANEGGILANIMIQELPAVLVIPKHISK